MRATDVEHVLTSRLLILQSKRLLLSSAQRQATRYGTEQLRARVERLRNEADHARAAYQKSVLDFAPAHHPDYWPVAYGRLIELGHRLSDELRDASASVSLHDRFAMSTDVEALEHLVQDWRKSMRRKIAAA